MKRKLISVATMLCVFLLAGCSELIPPRSTLPPVQPTEATVMTVPETEAATEAPTEPETIPEPEYFNPLNGTILDEPWSQRIFAVSINNLREAVPHYNMNKADIVIESFVNGSVIRDLALYTSTVGIEQIGPVRSDRLLFNDVCLAYDCIMIHSGGDSYVLQDCSARNMDHFNIEVWEHQDLTSFRDQDRLNKGWGWEHCLFARGDGILEYAQQSGMRTEMDPTIDYNLRFTDDGTPEAGTDAREITVTITYNQSKKDTGMLYSPELGKYVYHQYDQDMIDGATGEPEAFTNVLILFGDVYTDNGYQRLRTSEGGTGWYACGGKAISITWGSDVDDLPLWFATEDGQPLVLGRGNTYIAITQTGSQVLGIGS